MEVNHTERKPCLVITEVPDYIGSDDKPLSPKPSNSPRLDPKFPTYRIFPKLAEEKLDLPIKTEGWIWLRYRQKQEKKKDWKKRWFQITVRGLEYASDMKKKFKGVILFNTIKEVLCSPGKEPHLYQIHIISTDTIWLLSLERDKEASDAWYSSLQNFIDPKCFNIPRLVGIELEDSPRKPSIDIQKTVNLRKEFSLDGNEYALFELKCNLLVAKDCLTGILNVTENFLCFSAKNNNSKKLKINFSEVSFLEFESHHQLSKLILATKSDKYQLDFKNKYTDQIIKIFYLWYHTPTYFDNEDIQRAITVYQGERKKKEDLKVEQKIKEEKKEQRVRLLKEIGLTSSIKGSRGNLNISKHALTESSTNYIVISQQQNNITNIKNGQKYHKHFVIESEALYNIHHNYFPVILKLDVNTFSLTINQKFPYPDSLWSTKKLPKKDSVINSIFSYQNISTITVESEYEHLLIEFRGSEVSIRLCTAYIQLLLNQLYLKNNTIDIKWGMGVNPFSYEHALISKLFFLLKQPDNQYLFTSSSSLNL